MMATPIHVILLALTTFTIQYTATSSASPASQYQYPSGSLACKTFEMTRMDCSNRNLLDVPVMDNIFLTVLDLSHNYLTNITNSPFHELHVLVYLDLRNNKIYILSSEAFRGLRSVKYLYLRTNRLVYLPKDIFCDLSSLTALFIEFNDFTAIPSQALTPLHSLEYLSFGPRLADISLK